MPAQREIDKARELRDKEFARLRAEAAKATKGSTVTPPRKAAKAKKYSDATFPVAALMFVATMFGCAASVNAIEVEIKPQPCYSVQAYTVTASDSQQQYALIFNNCDSTFHWIKVPKPPEHEV